MGHDHPFSGSETHSQPGEAKIEPSEFLQSLSLEGLSMEPLDSFCLPNPNRPIGHHASLKEAFNLGDFDSFVSEIERFSHVVGDVGLSTSDEQRLQLATVEARSHKAVVGVGRGSHALDSLDLTELVGFPVDQLPPSSFGLGTDLSCASLSVNPSLYDGS